MAENAAELKELAEETVADLLELLEKTENKNDSVFRRVPRWEISHLINTIRHLCTSVLNLATTAAGSERVIQLKDDEIDALNREKLSLKLEINRLKAKLGE